jgi:hypothetical protein
MGQEQSLRCMLLAVLTPELLGIYSGSDIQCSCSLPPQNFNVFLTHIMAFATSDSLLLLLLLQWDEPSFAYTNGTAAAQSDIDLFLCPTRSINIACKAGQNTDNNVSAQQTASVFLHVR